MKVGMLANPYSLYTNELGGTRVLLISANTWIQLNRYISPLRKVLGQRATICWEIHDNYQTDHGKTLGIAYPTTSFRSDPQSKNQYS